MVIRYIIRNVFLNFHDCVVDIVLLSVLQSCNKEILSFKISTKSKLFSNLIYFIDHDKQSFDHDFADEKILEINY